MGVAAQAGLQPTMVLGKAPSWTCSPAPPGLNVFPNSTSVPRQALQDAVAVAVDILHSIDDFQNELTRWQVKRCQAQAGGSASKVREAAPSTADVQQRLRQLIQKLDGVLPYLNLAISSLALLSPGRMLWWMHEDLIGAGQVGGWQFCAGANSAYNLRLPRRFGPRGRRRGLPVAVRRGVPHSPAVC